MKRDLVIGVDASTTGAKAVVWNMEGQPLSQAKSTYPLSTPQPGWGEQNAEDWWEATANSVRRAVQTVDTSRIAAISVTHQRETFVCVDKENKPLRPAMLWLDSRATEEVEQFGNESIHRITGKPVNLTPAWYKLLWLQKHEPESMQRAAKIADVQAFLNNRLTGLWKTSYGSADPLGIIDMSTFDYSDTLLAQAGITRDQLPTLVAPGEIIGTVSDEVAEDLGLPKGLPVVAGVGDGQSAQLGTGAVHPGTYYLNLGSGVVSGTIADTYSYDKSFRVLAAGVAGKYTFETFIGGGTFNLQWFIEKFAGVDTKALGLELTPEQVLETAAAQLPPGAEGLMALPYWTGALTPYWDHHARGALIGFTGRHGKSHVYRAMLEGIAFEQRFLTEGAEKATGTKASQIIVLGGGSRSKVWCQIVADVLQRPVTVVRESESTCLGSGMLAAVAVGLHPDIETAARLMSGSSATFTPDPERIKIYQDLYEAYRMIYPALRDVFPHISKAVAVKQW
jgi:xylulokinase